MSLETDIHEIKSWWARLTDTEREMEIEKTKVSLAAADAGRVHKAKEVYARIRAKYANPDVR